MVESFDRTHEAEVAFLDEVEKAESRTFVATGDRHDEAKVALNKRLSRRITGAHSAGQLGAVTAGRLGLGVETLLRSASFEDRGRQATLVVG
ncbi:MAG: hypothetical protein RL550_705 [Actinomycetota bacterium]